MSELAERDGSGKPRPDSSRRPWRRRLWWVSTAAVAVAGVLLAATHRREWDEAIRLLGRADLDLLAVAAGLEAVSFLSLAGLELWLLRATGARLRLGPVAAVAAGANAMAGVLPGGGVLSLGWTVRQLQRRGVSLPAAVTALTVAGTVSVVVLGTLTTVGALVADPSGPAPGLRQAVLLGAAVCAGIGVVLGALSLSPRLRGAAVGRWHRLTAARPALARGEASLVDIARGARSLHPAVRDWVRPLLLSLLNWGCDAAALVLCLLCLGVRVPWRGFLLAYTLTQLLGSLRITPGSLGITEASLAALLVVYGLTADQAIAATLLYRGLSFWILQPIGWTCWLTVTWHARDRRPPPTEGPPV